MAEAQTIPARHGVATFVPAGQTIKIINSSGTQVVDMWAFALPAPERKKNNEAKSADEETTDKAESSKPQQQQSNTKAKSKNGNKGGTKDLPSQEDAEKATSQAMEEDDGEQQQQQQQQKSSWSSYVPSLGWSSGNKDKDEAKDGKESGETEQQKNSKTWSTYFPSGKGFSSYIPQSASDTVSAFAASHRRDPNKSYVQQLQDFAKTPVGAAGWSAVTGSGYSGSMYAGYQAWSMQPGAGGASEFLSMAHTRVATTHMRPKLGDVLVSNLREPMLTLVEDTSSGFHDTLVAACDPLRYKNLGVEKWDEHGSCAENLVLALKEINDRAGLTSTKAVGAGITVYSVPPPLNLFMKVMPKANGDLVTQAASNDADDFVRFRAERDVVVVMSACPMDLTWASKITPTEAHFLVEHEESTRDALSRAQVRKTVPPKKATATQPKTNTASNEPRPASTVAKPAPAPRTVPKTQTASATTQPQAARKKPIPPPVNPQKKPTAPAAEPKTQAQPVVRKKPRKLNPKPAN